jgi:hypothetical protein
VSSDSDPTEQHLFPPSAATPSCPETARPERELSHLRSMQVAAIRDATYLGMTGEQAQAFEERSLRIKEIIATLGRNKT